MPVNPHCGEKVPGVWWASLIGSMRLAAVTLHEEASQRVVASAGNPRLVTTAELLGRVRRLRQRRPVGLR